MASRGVLLPHFEELQIANASLVTCLNAVKATGEMVLPPRMDMCRWLHPFLVARIEFLEWSPDHRLRHARFGGIRSDKEARDVRLDGAS